MISTEIERIQASNERIKSNIASAYTKAEEKGATLPEVQNSENLPATIESIEQGVSASEWKPQSDWWDIESILENDTEEYTAKMICLLTDGLDIMTFTMNDTNKIAKIKTSDGAEYTSTATHTWDSTQDKECSFGYKTRYYIVYFNDTESTIKYNELPLTQSKYSFLYIILKNINLTVQATGNNSWLQNHGLLESIVFNNSTITESGGSLFTNSYLLQNIDLSKVFINNASRSFMNCYMMKDFNKLNIAENIAALNYTFTATITKEIPYINTSNVKDFQYAFSGNNKLQKITHLNLNNATNVNNIVFGCSNLKVISSISNIKISGLNFSSCSLLNHDTLIRILNALYDYSAGDTHTITLGATNLAKLTEEDLAIGTNKNWTIS